MPELELLIQILDVLKSIGLAVIIIVFCVVYLTTTSVLDHWFGKE